MHVAPFRQMLGVHSSTSSEKKTGENAGFYLFHVFIYGSLTNRLEDHSSMCPLKICKCISYLSDICIIKIAFFLFGLVLRLFHSILLS